MFKLALWEQIPGCLLPGNTMSTFFNITSAKAKTAKRRGAGLCQALFIFALLLLSPSLLKAASEPISSVQTLEWKKQLDQIEFELKNAPASKQLLNKLASALDETSGHITKAVAVSAPLAVDAKSLLDKLGKAPTNGQSPEPDEIAKQRIELSKRFGKIDSVLRSTQSLKERTDQIREQLHDRRRQLFTNQILRKSRSPLSPSLWQDGKPGLSQAFHQTTTIVGNWRQHNSLPHFLALIFAALVVALGLHKIMQGFIANYRRCPQGPPPFFKQAASAGVVFVMRAAPALTAAVIFYGGLVYMDMLDPPFDTLAPVAIGAFSAIAVLMALSTTLLAPNRDFWRVFPVSGEVATRLNRLVFAIATVYGVDLFIGALNKILLPPLSLTILQSALASLLFAGLLIAILRTPFLTREQASKKGGLALVRTLKIPLWGVVIAVLLATALGYIALARFLTQQTVVTGSLLILAYLAHLTIEEFTESFGDEETIAGHFLHQTYGLGTERREQTGAVSLLLLNALLILSTLPFLAVQWGFSWHDVSNWTHKILFGLEFGGLSISLVTVAVALIIFFLGIMVSNFFKNWLDRKILSKNRSKTGAEDSIKTAIGYLGIIVSALVALSYTGIGFGNIAIIAGALSLGIGFGLQSIVNNFVSGLILLVERPIKVGDWIGVAGEEGNVRRISVRSTEIETFDRSHIIIPNSELISGTVKNWTLRGHLGRIMINIGVSYDSDPDEVHDLLLKVTKAHPAVLETPAPSVVFLDFGASSLDFSIRAYLNDITSSLSVRSQLRFEILRALKKAQIEIPFPQSDIHLRDLDRLEKAFSSAPPQNQPRPSKRRKKSPQKPPQTS